MTTENKTRVGRPTVPNKRRLRNQVAVRLSDQTLSKLRRITRERGFHQMSEAIRDLIEGAS